ncbi:Plastid division protein CDP1 [Abeliophyllum distichum]|uniref:Plastid division protein CDP1 n=1 Tax=Abeliophyllum distichum TaxID=126358 RepID=A0ABD1PD66_9LAMI
MANIHTLVASVNNLCLHSENSNKFLCYNDCNDVLARAKGKNKKKKKKKCVEYFCDNGYGAGVSIIGRSWRLYAATEVRVTEYTSSKNGDAQSPTPFIEIPVTCYQILGVRDEAEKDEIVKSVMHLKSVEIEEGYTTDVVNSRQNLLMDVRDKLLFEPEYAGNVKEKHPPKSSLRIPWAWLACCSLPLTGGGRREARAGYWTKSPATSRLKAIYSRFASVYGPSGGAFLKCAIAKVGFMKNNISQGFEALARAQCLLRSKISLEKMTLLSQIEESLEELAPACTLELLGMPHMP